MRYLAIHKERALRLTKDIIGKPVFTQRGFKLGKISDLTISNTAYGMNYPDIDFPTVNGILIEHSGLKAYVPWEHVTGFGNIFLLRSGFGFAKPAGTFIVKRILDKQLIDQYERHIGRVDDIKFSYSIGENLMRLLGFYSSAGGALIRFGIGKSDVIPWACVSKIRDENPTAIVLSLAMKKLTPSMYDKYMVYEIKGNQE